MYYSCPMGLIDCEKLVYQQVRRESKPFFIERDTVPICLPWNMCEQSINAVHECTHTHNQVKTITSVIKHRTKFKRPVPKPVFLLRSGRRPLFRLQWGDIRHAAAIEFISFNYPQDEAKCTHTYRRWIQNFKKIMQGKILTGKYRMGGPHFKLTKKQSITFQIY